MKPFVKNRLFIIIAALLCITLCFLVGCDGNADEEGATYEYADVSSRIDLSEEFSVNLRDGANRFKYVSVADEFFYLELALEEEYEGEIGGVELFDKSGKPVALEEGEDNCALFGDYTSEGELVSGEYFFTVNMKTGGPVVMKLFMELKSEPRFDEAISLNDFSVNNSSALVFNLSSLAAGQKAILKFDQLPDALFKWDGSYDFVSGKSAPEVLSGDYDEYIYRPALRAFNSDKVPISVSYAEIKDKYVGEQREDYTVYIEISIKRAFPSGTFFVLFG